MFERARRSFGLLILMVAGALCATELANYPVMTTMKSGDHKLLTASTDGPNNTVTYTQSFFLTFSTLPKVAISIRDFQVRKATTNSSTPSNSINYKCTIGSITTTNFRTTLDLLSATTFGLLYYMYIGLDLTLVANTYLYYYSIDTSGLFNDTNGVSKITTNSITQTISDYSKAVVTPIVMSFSVTTSHQYSFFTSAKMIDSQNYQLNISSNSYLQRIDMTVFIVDKTKLESTYKYYIDSGSYKAYPNITVPISTFSPPSFNFYNYILGMTSFRVNSSFNPNFFLTPSDTYGTYTQYVFLEYSALHWRMRQCIQPSTIGKFVLEEQLCYDVCPDRYATNSSLDYCVRCYYTCQTCKVDGTSCLSCPNNTFRTLANSTSQCGCNVGYFDNGAEVCSSCNYTCLTCSSMEGNCTSCDGTRNLTSNTCPCSTGYFDVGNSTKTCSSCDFTCLTCEGKSTRCTSCDSTNHFRVLIASTGKCLCKSGYQDTGSAQCAVSSLTCSSPCLTCQTTSTTCTSCSSTSNPEDRVLSNSRCVCPTDYTSVSSTSVCYVVCGNGLMPANTTKQCDDGNTLDGDGCSGSCSIESGFTCTNSSTCISNSGYNVISQSLTKSDSSNQITVVIRMTPVPPSSTVPTLSNLQDYLSLQSYSLNRGTMTVNMNLERAVDSSQVLNIRMPLISTSAGIPMIDSNNLELVPYSKTYYDIYNVETAFIWVYIAVLWAGAIYRVITEPKLISQVTELFFYSSLVWIGVVGQRISSAPLTPIVNLKNIFGYNVRISDNNSLFAVFNIGFAYCLIPLLMYLILLLVGKKCPGSVTSRTKRFVLYDLTLSWLMVNGFLIMYGFSLVVTGGLGFNGVTGAGLVIVLVYLVLMGIAGYRSFFRGASLQDINPTLENTKKNLFKPGGYFLLWFCSLLMSFIYLGIKNRTEVNPLLMMVYFLLMFIVVGVGNIYINKVRPLLNIVSLCLIYGCILLINNVSNASWIGMLIVGLMFVQLIFNFVMMHFERNRLKVDDEEIEDEKNKAEQNLEGLVENNNGDVSGRENNLAGHTGLFTIYEPPEPIRVKQPEIVADLQQERREYATNAIDTILRNNEKNTDKERMSDMKQNLRQFLMTSPKNKNVIDGNKQKEEFIDLDKREVDMTAF